MAVPTVVADSSPLILLAKLDRFTLLYEFYSHIVIPPAVWREVVTEGRGRAGAEEVAAARAAGWLEVHSPHNQHFLQLLRLNLDDGEAETLALALELGAELVLLDEADARDLADV